MTVIKNRKIKITPNNLKLSVRPRKPQDLLKKIIMLKQILGIMLVNELVSKYCVLMCNKLCKMSIKKSS